ncbi:hypothetical protein DFQ28_001619 [Apophysomyces sp. BC1034]|nr:hypothetical protein DFQ30_007745 [Apophysomyces sp. BC1015]KAG0180209.1 hypothetical protein DFQ29_001031 [Apophysomyces sp. BC1021]KAG0190772.1 hypothetical protein DFQ28_001619 [Apophysomyces sp. BC1034]
MAKRTDKELSTLLQKYDEFVNLKLKPDLKDTLESRNEIFDTLSEYQKLKSQIELIQTHDLKELKTMVDLGSQFYAQAVVPDTQYIYLNVGFGFHVQFTLDEAKDFIEKKEKRLQSTVDKYSADADKIRAHIKMVLEAMAEILEAQKNA